MTTSTTISSATTDSGMIHSGVVHSGVVHAEIVWLRDDPAYPHDELKTHLSAHEQETLRAFAHPERQRSFLLSRVLLRQLLAKHLPPDNIQFTRTPNGRLVLAGKTAPHFSLSHADGCVAVIVCAQPCGIDIEKPRTAALEKVAARYFSAAENAALAACPPATRAASFFRLWTLKEASVKALGEGLANNMERLSFDISGAQPRLHDRRIGLQLWQTQLTPLWLAAAVKTDATVDWSIRQTRLAEC
jgi:4'-phosphopantetheinyl transferase